MLNHGIKCGKGHMHDSVQSVRECYAVAAPVVRTASVTTPAHRHVLHTSAAPTPSQLHTLTRLGGFVTPGMTRGEASSVIGRLLDSRKSKPVTTERHTMSQSTIAIPTQMLFDIREGRYAVSPEGNAHLDFMRLKVVKPVGHKYNRYTGWLKIQSQHSETLMDRCLISPDGRVIMLGGWSVARMQSVLLTIITDQKTAAIRYGQEMGQCCRCGKKLTDEHSRWYGIGPECVKHWPEIVDEVNEARGVFDETLVSN